MDWFAVAVIAILLCANALIALAEWRLWRRDRQLQEKILRRRFGDE